MRSNSSCFIGSLTGYFGVGWVVVDAKPLAAQTLGNTGCGACAYEGVKHHAARWRKIGVGMPSAVSPARVFVPNPLVVEMEPSLLSPLHHQASSEFDLGH